ncbi:MAG: methyltransferase domain-containing protein [Candidatus Binataceae bacterium]
MDPRLTAALVCPRDHDPLESSMHALRCARGHSYPVIDEIPIMLLDDVAQTLGVADDALREAAHLEPEPARADTPIAGQVDAYVMEAIAATGGFFYRPLIGSLREYPIPSLRIPQASPGKRFLDLGCNWGRWCIAAARLGYSAFGIDPSLDGIRAARRVALQLNVDAHYVVGDARFLPFRDASFELVHSYSVLQHFAKSDAKIALAEARRTLRAGGTAIIQMPNRAGIRCLYHQLRRSFREPQRFEVRYWTPKELRETGASLIGPSKVSVDGFFSLNPQPNTQLPLRFRLIAESSEILRRGAEYFPPLLYVADSLYLTAQKP